MEITQAALTWQEMEPRLDPKDTDGFDAILAWVLGLGQDIIQVHGKDIELLGKDLVDVALQAGRCVGKSERHDLMFRNGLARPNRSRDSPIKGNGDKEYRSTGGRVRRPDKSTGLF